MLWSVYYDKKYHTLFIVVLYIFSLISIAAIHVAFIMASFKDLYNIYIISFKKEISFLYMIFWFHMVSWQCSFCNYRYWNSTTPQNAYLYTNNYHIYPSGQQFYQKWGTKIEQTYNLYTYMYRYNAFGWLHVVNKSNNIYIDVTHCQHELFDMSNPTAQHTQLIVISSIH